MSSRRVVVQVLSARGELLLVARVSMAISVGIWIYLAFASGIGYSGAGQRSLLPFQRLIADRPPVEQRMFRELQEGLLEAEAVRTAAGRWPQPAALADEGVPPFAPDPTRRTTYVWTLTASGIYINYLGIPADASSPAWLVAIQEPEAGVPPDQTFEDEEHHKLANGTMLHVSTWTHAAASTLPRRLVRMPQAEGWTQLYAVAPAAPSLRARP